MKLKMFVDAHFRLRNILALVTALVAAYIADTMMPGVKVYAYTAAVALYFVFVISTLTSKKYHEDFAHRQKIRHIQDLNYACLRLSSEAKKYVNDVYMKKLRKVIEDKNEIVNSFFRGERGYLKEKIVEQTLNLVVSYTKLLMNFCVRSREVNGMDISSIANRINLNVRKLSFAKDPGTADDIRKVIEMDEKIINRLKEEKKDLERISTKLDYMESTVNMFKHQIMSNIETEEMLGQLETAVNEATALDNVLEERRKNRISM